MSKSTDALEELLGIQRMLLAPGGCPWDQEQTHQSLVRYLIEETYEVIEAIEQGDMHKLREELGDLLLQVVFHAALAEERGDFNFADVTRFVSQKMVNRHPHVFGSMQLETSDDVLDKWETFKRREGKKYLLDGIPKALPALMRAEKIQEKMSRVGYDWPDVTGAVDKFREELIELDQAHGQDEIIEEMGDVLFALVNVARFKKVEVEQALQSTNDKVTKRFNYIEDVVRSRGQSLEQLTLKEMDAIWDEAKGQGL
ncbi:MAG: nucleoside triphosphate pyrophosphohydrolase [Syntrophomonadaceae bacterium]|jgi:tetrapyrrole methylase family protein/MazG family protein|nr:nucleoside triphosphate pyrophosphohydrolase [Syntrophomonadaceae bacterium]